MVHAELGRFVGSGSAGPDGGGARPGAGLGTLSLSFRFFAQRLHPRRACASSSASSFTPRPCGAPTRGRQRGAREGAGRTVDAAAAVRERSWGAQPLSLPGGHFGRGKQRPWPRTLERDSEDDW